jgi:hypothetical protein
MPEPAAEEGHRACCGEAPIAGVADHLSLVEDRDASIHEQIAW